MERHQLMTVGQKTKRMSFQTFPTTILVIFQKNLDLKNIFIKNYLEFCDTHIGLRIALYLTRTRFGLKSTKNL